VLTVAEVSSVNEVVGLGAPAAVGVVELEGPEEVGGLLEVGTNGGNLVDQILNANDAVLAERLLDDVVVRQTDAASCNLAVATLVDEAADGLEGGGTAKDENCPFTFNPSMNRDH
jgi:hypothetical protein